MSRSNLLTSADVSEYDRIEMAMSESDRGRWFLTEFARRNRGADTQSVLGAIARLESVVTQGRDESQIGGQVGRMRGDLMDMANAIARTKAEIAALGTPEHESSRLGGASLALDAIVRSTERATSDILSAAEDVQETAWTLRETGSDAAMCDTLDQRATQIYTACSFQDLTAQRTARIIHTLRYLEERVGSMMAIWGDALDTVPPAPDATTTAAPIDLSQSDVDRFIEDGPVATASVAEKATAAQPEASAAPTAALALAAPEATAEMQTAEATEEADAVPDSAPTDAMEQSEAAVESDIATAFADIDSLTEEEKRALFS
ncbi:hypothetical protein [Methylobacterium gossipiicola]|uniref:Chemotaxis protein CheZ n=1 Tax=Methylobacterium gossipiicola TaxID=582675 RepID=A0A1I2SPP5_9HYPH|nr:hypothetical protein [Methylobacterium gossipiicola]SFG54602.1 hypothetical protein SAMN05192565_105111 [Methylobacterium gossipiicola]